MTVKSCYVGRKWVEGGREREEGRGRKEVGKGRGRKGEKVPISCLLHSLYATRASELAWLGCDHTAQTKRNMTQQLHVHRRNMIQYNKTNRVPEGGNLKHCHVGSEQTQPRPLKCPPLLTQPHELWGRGEGGRGGGREGGRERGRK